jgi:hypothetical protein
MALWAVGERVDGLTVDGKAIQARVFDEVQVRAAAGLTLVVGTVAFCYAYFEHQYVPIRAVAVLYFFDFLIRITVGLKYSPTGALAGVLTWGRKPQWVSAKPKRFAWTLGMLLSGATAVITNIPIHGYLPRTLCLICLVLMWMETALGLCLGCEIYAFMVRRGWRAGDPDYEICAGGACDLPAAAARSAAAPSATPASTTPAGPPVIAALRGDTALVEVGAAPGPAGPGADVVNPRG